MPVKRRRSLHRHNDFDAWASTLGSGLDFFGELPSEDLEEEEGRRSCTPRVEAAQSAWERHGARLLAEKACQPAKFGNGSPWGLWAFGPPPDADPAALAACAAMMRDDWDAAPDWADTKAAAGRRNQHRERLKRDAHFTGVITPWVRESFSCLWRTTND